MEELTEHSGNSENLSSSSPPHENSHAPTNGSASQPSRQESPNPNSAKSRRKRTSAHDHAILEAAYLKNSKPDKSERAEIVRLVQLGEKEVQIWFQNRRQNDRRRSKPLLPHELLAHFHNYAPSLPTPSQSFDASAQPIVPTTNVDQSQQSSPSSQPSDPAPTTSTSSRPLNVHDLLDPAPVQVSPRPTIETIAVEPIHEHVDHTPPPSFEVAPSQSTSPDPGSQGPSQDTQPARETTPGSGKKRAYDEMAGKAVGENSASAEHGANEETGSGIKPSRDPLKRTSSVRLAVTADGAVKIRTNDELTPSPPKKRTAPPIATSRSSTSITRSKSAVDAVEIFRDSTRINQPRQPGVGFGRSRDTRTWEFFCDSSARDALAAQAEAETAGSAVSAINLIRSNSYKSRIQALSPSVSKTNVHPGGTRRKSDKPKLSRARSSMARLQGLARDSPQRLEKIDLSQPAPSPSGDSDKENWAPGTRDSDHNMRRTQASSSRRAILQDNADHIFRDVRPGTQPDDNPEITGTKEKAKGEDLDCVQSLLSLSQGAWR